MKRFKSYMAFDPGSQGGVAYRNKQSVIGSFKTPKDIDGMAELITEHDLDCGKETLCVIEKVQMNPTDLDIPGKAININKLIANTRAHHAIIKSMGIKVIEVHPATWQSQLGLRKKKGEAGREKKNRCKEFAKSKSMFSGQDIYLWNADAFCILYWLGQKLLYKQLNSYL